MSNDLAQVLKCLVLGGGVLLAGCDKPQAKAPPTPSAVTVAQPIKRAVQDYDEYTGRLAAVESVEVRARVKGYLDQVGFKDGDEVKKGRLLFQIDPRPFEAAVKAAEGQLDVVKARRVRASADVARYKDLVPKGAATQQDLDRAVGELGEAEASIRAAAAELERARLDLGFAKVTAPIDGMASRAILTVGNLVGAAGSGEQLLTTLVSIDPIHIYFDVDQRMAQQYRAAAIKRMKDGAEPKTVRDMKIRFQFGLASEEGFPHEGVLDFIDNKVDPATGTIMVRGEVANAQRLFRPGFFARVRVPTSESYQAVLVAERAIGTQQGQKYVLVVDSKDKVAFRPVKLGALQSDGLRVITSGVGPEERIVVNGIQRARPGAAVKPEPSEMLLRPRAPAPATQSVTRAG